MKIHEEPCEFIFAPGTSPEYGEWTRAMIAVIGLIDLKLFGEVGGDIRKRVRENQGGVYQSGQVGGDSGESDYAVREYPSCQLDRIERFV
jgi:hypothetical protein